MWGKTAHMGKKWTETDPEMTDDRASRESREAVIMITFLLQEPEHGK